jgi:hypothetical protein
MHGSLDPSFSFLRVPSTLLPICFYIYPSTCLLAYSVCDSISTHILSFPSIPGKIPIRFAPSRSLSLDRHSLHYDLYRLSATSMFILFLDFLTTVFRPFIAQALVITCPPP